MRLEHFLFVKFVERSAIGGRDDYRVVALNDERRETEYRRRGEALKDIIRVCARYSDRTRIVRLLVPPTGGDSWEYVRVFRGEADSTNDIAGGGHIVLLSRDELGHLGWEPWRLDPYLFSGLDAGEVRGPGALDRLVRTGAPGPRVVSVEVDANRLERSGLPPLGDLVQVELAEGCLRKGWSTYLREPIAPGERGPTPAVSEATKALAGELLRRSARNEPHGSFGVALGLPRLGASWPAWVEANQIRFVSFTVMSGGSIETDLPSGVWADLSTVSVENLPLRGPSVGAPSHDPTSSRRLASATPRPALVIARETSDGVSPPPRFVFRQTYAPWAVAAGAILATSVALGLLLSARSELRQWRELAADHGGTAESSALGTAWRAIEKERDGLKNARDEVELWRRAAAVVLPDSSTITPGQARNAFPALRTRIAHAAEKARALRNRFTTPSSETPTSSRSLADDLSDLGAIAEIDARTETLLRSESEWRGVWTDIVGSPLTPADARARLASLLTEEVQKSMETRRATDLQKSVTALNAELADALRKRDAALNIAEEHRKARKTAEGRAEALNAEVIRAKDVDADAIRSARADEEKKVIRQYEALILSYEKRVLAADQDLKLMTRLLSAIEKLRPTDAPKPVGDRTSEVMAALEDVNSSIFLKLSEVFAFEPININNYLITRKDDPLRRAAIWVDPKELNAFNRVFEGIPRRPNVAKSNTSGGTR